MTEQGNGSASGSEYSSKVIEAMVDALKASTSPELLQAQQMLLRRLALTGDVVPSRFPPPRNISEVGGYINLLRNMQKPELLEQALASVLGVAGPNPPLGWDVSGPVLHFASRQNDRPAGPRQSAIPLEFTVRSDFAGSLDAALEHLHVRGCALPLLTPVRSLPSAHPGSLPSKQDVLSLLGRAFDLVPSTALHDPDNDPVALARLTAGGSLQVVTRQLDQGAPSSGEVAAADWTAWTCTVDGCQESSAQRTYLALAPVLNAAGWYQNDPAAPNSLKAPGSWHRWSNTTGLVEGATPLGDELALLYAPEAIAVSALRDQLQWVWNGTDFAASHA